MRIWRFENAAKTRATKKAWCQHNPDIVRASIAKWRAKNREHLRVYREKWRLANPSKIAEAARNHVSTGLKYVNEHPSASLFPAMVALDKLFIAGPSSNRWDIRGENYETNIEGPMSPLEILMMKEELVT